MLTRARLEYAIKHASQRSVGIASSDYNHELSLSVTADDPSCLAKIFSPFLGEINWHNHSTNYYSYDFPRVQGNLSTQFEYEIGEITNILDVKLDWIPRTPPKYNFLVIPGITLGTGSLVLKEISSSGKTYEYLAQYGPKTPRI